MKCNTLQVKHNALQGRVQCTWEWSAMHFRRSVSLKCTEVCTSVHWKCTTLRSGMRHVNLAVFTAYLLVGSEDFPTSKYSIISRRSKSDFIAGVIPKEGLMGDVCRDEEDHNTYFSVAWYSSFTRISYKAFYLDGDRFQSVPVLTNGLLCFRGLGPSLLLPVKKRLRHSSVGWFLWESIKNALAKWTVYSSNVQHFFPDYFHISAMMSDFNWRNLSLLLCK